LGLEGLQTMAIGAQGVDEDFGQAVLLDVVVGAKVVLVGSADHLVDGNAARDTSLACAEVAPM
jgi:hypothetical protein